MIAISCETLKRVANLTEHPIGCCEECHSGTCERQNQFAVRKVKQHGNYMKDWEGKMVCFGDKPIEYTNLCCRQQKFYTWMVYRSAMKWHQQETMVTKQFFNWLKEEMGEM